jgi:hypothetical protein
MKSQHFQEKEEDPCVWQQKIAEEMLDAGSIEYFQEEEEYYNEGGIMLQDAFLNHTAERAGERGNTDSDGRITARGRAHFRKISLALRGEEPYEQATPHPSPAILIDLTGDDSNFF